VGNTGEQAQKRKVGARGGERRWEERRGNEGGGSKDRVKDASQGGIKIRKKVQRKFAVECHIGELLVPERAGGVIRGKKLAAGGFSSFKLRRKVRQLLTIQNEYFMRN